MTLSPRIASGRGTCAPLFMWPRLSGASISLEWSSGRDQSSAPALITPVANRSSTVFAVLPMSASPLPILAARYPTSPSILDLARGVKIRLPYSLFLLSLIPLSPSTKIGAATATSPVGQSSLLTPPPSKERKCISKCKNPHSLERKPKEIAKVISVACHQYVGGGRGCRRQNRCVFVR